MSHTSRINSFEPALSSHRASFAEVPPYLGLADGVRIICERKDIESLRDSWSGWSSIPNSDIDQYLTVLESLSGAKPLVIVVYGDHRPVTVLAGRIESGNVRMRVGYCDVSKRNVRQLVFIHGGLMGDVSPDSCEVLVKAINSLLRGKIADVAYFNSLNSNSPLHVALQSQASVLRDHFPVVERHRRLDLPGASQEFYRSLSPKVRKNLAWQSRKLQKEFSPENVKIKCFREGAELDEMFRDVEAIAGKAYQRGLGVGFVDSPLVRSLMGLAAKKKWLRAYVLYIAGRPAAFWIGKVYKATFHSDYMGYDTDFGKYSPGMFLITSVIEGLCERREGEIVSRIDFGLGDAQYKEVLGSDEWRDASFYLFSPRLSGLGLNLLRTPVTGIDYLAKRILSRIKLLQKSKRIWRSKVVQQVKMGSEA